MHHKIHILDVWTRSTQLLVDRGEIFVNSKMFKMSVTRMTLFLLVAGQVVAQDPTSSWEPNHHESLGMHCWFAWRSGALCGSAQRLRGSEWLTGLVPGAIARAALALATSCTGVGNA